MTIKQSEISFYLHKSMWTVFIAWKYSNILSIFFSTHLFTWFEN